MSTQAVQSPAPKAYLGHATYGYGIVKTKVGIFYCAFHPSEGATCYAAAKGGNIVAAFLNQNDMLAGENSHRHWTSEKAIESLGDLLNELEDEEFISTPPTRGI